MTVVLCTLEMMSVPPQPEALVGGGISYNTRVPGYR